MKRLGLLFLALLCLSTSQAYASDFVNFGVRASNAALGKINLPTANLVELYSVFQQRGYSGPCLKVQRSTDSQTLDIGFLNGVCDVASAMAFAGSGTNNSIKFYNQVAGGLDATATPPNAPFFTSVNEVYGIPGITLNPSSLSQIFSLPSGISLNTQSQTVISVQAPFISQSSLSSNLAPAWLLGNPFTQGGNSLGINSGGDTLFHNGTFQNTGLFSGVMQPSVTVVTSSPTSKTYQLNNTLLTGLSATGSATTTGGIIGSIQSGGGYYFYGQLYVLAVYNTVLTQPVIAPVVSDLLTKFGVPTTYSYQYIFDGDSITQGVGSTLQVNYPYQTMPLLSHPGYARNTGLAGEFLGTMVSNETAFVLNSYNAALTKNFVIEDGGTNDICVGGTSGASLLTTVQTYVANARTKGFIVIPGTLIYNNSCSTAQKAERINYNTGLRSWASANGITVADFDSIPQLQNPVTPGYGSGDGIHPSTLGYSVMAAVAAAAINANLP